MTILLDFETKLFSKYWGEPHLEDVETFWSEVFEAYRGAKMNLPVPLQLNAFDIRYARELLDCPSGTCADCCHYAQVPITEREIQRIVDNTDYTLDDVEGQLGANDKGRFLRCQSGCMFLEDKACKIYDHRPDICWLFPIQPTTSTGQMMIRPLCESANKVIRKLVTDLVKKTNALLLPNLNIVPREVK